MENKVSFLDKYKKRSKIAIANDIVVLVTVIAIVIAVILAYIGLSQEWVLDGEVFAITKYKVLDYFLVPLLAMLTLAGVVSVVASNNKAPIALLVLSSLSTIYKFSYPVVQLIAGQDNINTSPLIGQPILMFTLIIQVYFWIRWNKMTDEGKFISESFKGKRTYIAFSIIGVILLVQIILSIYINAYLGSSTGLLLVWTVFVDVSGSILYLTASILMAFGNILCFPIFLLSDLSWMYWTILDLFTTSNPLLLIIAILTFIQVLAYSLLAITGFIQWFNDDYEWSKENKKIVRKEGRELR